jgi:hypothetical protein
VTIFSFFKRLKPNRKLQMSHQFNTLKQTMMRR